MSDVSPLQAETTKNEIKNENINHHAVTRAAHQVTTSDHIVNEANRRNEQNQRNTKKIKSVETRQDTL